MKCLLHSRKLPNKMAFLMCFFNWFRSWLMNLLWARRGTPSTWEIVTRTRTKDSDQAGVCISSYSKACLKQQTWGLGRHHNDHTVEWKGGSEVSNIHCSCKRPNFSPSNPSVPQVPKSTCNARTHPAFTHLCNLRTEFKTIFNYIAISWPTPHVCL